METFAYQEPSGKAQAITEQVLALLVRRPAGELASCNSIYCQPFSAMNRVITKRRNLMH